MKIFLEIMIKRWSIIGFLSFFIQNLQILAIG